MSGRLEAERGKLDFWSVTFVRLDRGKDGGMKQDGSGGRTLFFPYDFTDGSSGGVFKTSLEPGDYQVVARAPRCLPTIVDRIRVKSGEELRGLVLRLRQGKSILGSVRAGKKPIVGALIVVDGHGYRENTWTDGDGEFVVNDLAPGSYRVRGFDQEAGYDERQATAGSPVALQLEAGLQLRGRVCDETGKAVAGAGIFGVVYPEYQGGAEFDPGGEIPVMDRYPGLDPGLPRPACRQLATTGDAGRFSIRVGASARLLLGAASGDKRALLPDIQPGGPEVVLELRSVPAVRLRVTDDQGAPAEAKVSINVNRFDLTPGACFSAATLATQPDGSLAFTPWPGIALTLRARRGKQIVAVDPLPPTVTIGRAQPMFEMHDHPSCGYLVGGSAKGRDRFDTGRPSAGEAK